MSATCRAAVRPDDVPVRRVTRSGARLPFGSKAAAAKNGVAEHEYVSVMVAAFTDGLTDKQVATRLGIGLRTLVRYVREEMAAAGTCSRFQWGYRLGLATGRQAARREAAALAEVRRRNLRGRRADHGQR